MSNCCWYETLLHFGLQSSHLNICYYHQYLHQELFYSGSRQELHSKHLAFLLIAAPRDNNDWVSVTRLSANHFRCSPFGRWVVTHSLADFNTLTMQGMVQLPNPTAGPSTPAAHLEANVRRAEKGQGAPARQRRRGTLCHTGEPRKKTETWAWDCKAWRGWRGYRGFTEVCGFTGHQKEKKSKQWAALRYKIQRRLQTWCVKDKFFCWSCHHLLLWSSGLLRILIAHKQITLTLYTSTQHTLSVFHSRFTFLNNVMMRHTSSTAVEEAMQAEQERLHAQALRRAARQCDVREPQRPDLLVTLAADALAAWWALIFGLDRLGTDRTGTHRYTCTVD